MIHRYETRAGSFAFELDPELKLQTPVLRMALAAWQAARGARAMPARADVDVAKLPRELLGHLALLEIEPGPPERFRWRLIGTHITAALGRDSTGRYFDELYEPQLAEAVLTGPRWVMAHRRPIRTLGHAAFADKTFLRSENLDMPLSSDGERVSMILVATVFQLGDGPN